MIYIFCLGSVVIVLASIVTEAFTNSPGGTLFAKEDTETLKSMAIMETKRHVTLMECVLQCQNKFESKCRDFAFKKQQGRNGECHLLRKRDSDTFENGERLKNIEYFRKVEV